MKQDVRKKFQKYHRKNPSVEQDLVQIARRLQKRGVERYSIDGLIAALRYESIVNATTLTKDYSGVKISNNYKPFYARLIMRKHKDLKGFFNIRTQFANA